ncbi:MAG: hypothetical protein PHT77_05515 [Bacteroidales bacterium]|nr:hypothetical protein [Bacteroidales bacterium]
MTRCKASELSEMCGRPERDQPHQHEDTIELLSINDMEELPELMRKSVSERLKEKGYVWCGGSFGNKQSCDTFRRDKFDLYEKPIRIILEVP